MFDKYSLSRQKSRYLPWDSDPAPPTYFPPSDSSEPGKWKGNSGTRHLGCPALPKPLLNLNLSVCFSYEQSAVPGPDDSRTSSTCPQTVLPAEPWLGLYAFRRHRSFF